MGLADLADYFDVLMVVCLLSMDGNSKVGSRTCVVKAWSATHSSFIGCDDQWLAWLAMVSSRRDCAIKAICKTKREHIPPIATNHYLYPFAMSVPSVVEDSAKCAQPVSTLL